MTIVAEWRYALTGVGATIARGSHEWNGYCARLRERTDEDEGETDVHQRARGRIGEQLADPVRARLSADQQEAAQHRQSADAGDEERLQRRGSRFGTPVLVADEEERRDRRELPEPVQHEQVVGHDESDHRPAEQHEQSGEPADSLSSGGQVAGGVGEHEDADAGYENQHQRPEGVEAKIECQPERRDPVDVLGERLPVEHAGEADADPGQRGCRSDDPNERATPPEARAAGDDGGTDQGMEREEGDHDLTEPTPTATGRRAGEGEISQRSLP